MDTQTTLFVGPKDQPEADISYQSDGVTPYEVLRVGGHLALTGVTLHGSPQDIDAWLERAVAAHNKARSGWLAYRCDEAKTAATVRVSDGGPRRVKAADLKVGDIIDMPGEDLRGLVLTEVEPAPAYDGPSQSPMVSLRWGDGAKDKVRLFADTYVTVVGHRETVTLALSGPELLNEHGSHLAPGAA